ncbi:hypothetical protein RUMTOR_02916, partial [[Ruminococcus] torques ATCC 27756]
GKKASKRIQQKSPAHLGGLNFHVGQLFIDKALMSYRDFQELRKLKWRKKSLDIPPLIYPNGIVKNI